MTQYGDVNVKLPISQLNRLKSVLKNKTEISQRKNEKKDCIEENSLMIGKKN